MREKEIHSINGHFMLTLEMDEKEFMEFRDTMNTIENMEYEILDIKPRLPSIHETTVCGRAMMYWMPDRGCAYTVRINDRIDESIEAYTAGAYLAGTMTEADANRLMAWRENAESVSIESCGMDV